MNHQPDPLSSTARAYLAQVDARLRDLSPAEHVELLDDVEARLVELAPDQSPTAVLGEPSAFADDLRQAAGLAPTLAVTDERPASLLSWIRTQAGRRPVADFVDYLRSLQPAWWAIRGYLLFALGLVVADHPEHWGLHSLGHYSQVYRARAVHAVSGWPVWLPPWLLLVVVSVVASVVLGRVTDRLDPRYRIGVAALDVVAVVVLLAWPTWWLAPSFAYVTGLAG